MGRLTGPNPCRGKRGHEMPDQFEQWNIADYRNELPYSNRVSIPILLQAFSSTSSSYKYLFFLSLLEVLEEERFTSRVLRLDRILLQMLVRAYYPHAYFRLSFGANDRIAQELDRLGRHLSINNRTGASAEARLRSAIASCDYTDNSLLALVPYRLIAPFFAQELRGKRDAERNRMILHLAESRFESVRPFYCFTGDCRSIILHHEWMLYFHENLKLVKSFISWNWLTYMQRRNPAVPNIQLKLFPPHSRGTLTVQTEFYRTVLQQQTFHCIYSGQRLSAEDFSLDHFLPWSFVAHDQLWNLIPVSQSINASKSDNLPSLARYFTQFVRMQHQALLLYRGNPGKIPWRRIAEPYVADLRLTSEDILDPGKLAAGLRTMIEPLHALASSQGFPHGWEMPLTSR